MIFRAVDAIGRGSMGFCAEAGSMVLFVYNAIVTLFTTKLKITKVFRQANYIGVNSIGVIILTGSAIGAILAIEAHVGLHKFGTERFIGPLTFLSMAREFGPVISAIMVTGRAISAMTAEIGSMRITEQLDALKTLSINVNQYLIVPRILATTLILPFLSIFCTLFGFMASYIMSVYALNINPETYMEAVREYAELGDITKGLLKAGIFGFLISSIGAYKGYTTWGGAKGVGIATTQSVVIANVTIFMADYILSAFMWKA
jgi:phospholipid/cholesterol/gamma-HCH transport system permease protein